MRRARRTGALLPLFGSPDSEGCGQMNVFTVGPS